MAIIKPKKKEILEVREVTNWHRIAKNGQRIFMAEEKKDNTGKTLLIVGVVILVIMMLCCCCAGGMLLLGSSSDTVYEPYPLESFY